MQKFNPEIESQLDILTAVCCDQMGERSGEDTDRVSAVLKSLLIGGFKRISEKPLGVCVEERVVDRCREPAIHRRAELNNILQTMQRDFDKMAQQQTEQPGRESGTRPANISSATDA